MTEVRFILLDVKRNLKNLVLKIQSLGKNYVYIESIGCRCPSDGKIQAPEACTLTKIQLDNMLVEDDKRES
jgi:hypothetical protein